MTLLDPASFNFVVGDTQQPCTMCTKATSLVHLNYHAPCHLVCEHLLAAQTHRDLRQGQP